VAGAFFLVTWAVPGFHHFYDNIRRDWTFLSYGFYACALFLFTVHDQDVSPHLNLLVILPSLIGVLGALAYLRIAVSLHRMAALISSMMLGAALWWYPNFYDTISWRGLSSALTPLLVVWGILGVLILAPILVNIKAVPKAKAPM
jgi:hypothetical protein